MRPIWASLGLAALAWAASCGGTAVVDGGSGGSGNATATTATGGTQLCSTPAPVGQVEFCGGTGSSGGTCLSSNCDQGGNVWESSCQDRGCVCSFNGVQRCVCALDGPGQFCTGSIPSCCPKPFPD